MFATIHSEIPWHFRHDGWSVLRAISILIGLGGIAITIQPAAGMDFLAKHTRLKISSQLIATRTFGVLLAVVGLFCFFLISTCA